MNRKLIQKGMGGYIVGSIENFEGLDKEILEKLIEMLYWDCVNYLRKNKK